MKRGNPRFPGAEVITDSNADNAPQPDFAHYSLKQIKSKYNLIAVVDVSPSGYSFPTQTLLQFSGAGQAFRLRDGTFALVK